MRIVPTLLFAGLFAASAAHAEKKIYRCTNSDGSSVFSPYPCGAGAEEMKVEATAPAAPITPAPRASIPTAATTPAAPAPPVVDADDIKCLQDASGLKAYPARANLDMLQQRQAELMRTYTRDTSEATRVLIGNMDATIAAEQARIDEGRQHAERAYAQAIDKCQARKAARDKQGYTP